MRRRVNVISPEEKRNSKETKKTLLKLGKSWKKYLGWRIVSFILLIVCVVTGIYAPQALSDLTNVINDGRVGHNVNRDKVFHYGIILVILYSVTFVSNILSTLIRTAISSFYTKDLREQISIKINKIPLRYFDTHSIGDILSRLTNDVDRIGQSFSQSVATRIYSFFRIIGARIARLTTQWARALICIARIPVRAILLFFIRKFAGPQFLKRQQDVGDVNGIVEENDNGQRVIKLFSAEEKRNKRFEDKNQALSKSRFRSELYGGLRMPIRTFRSYVCYALVCLSGGLFRVNGSRGVTMGTITAFLRYVNLFRNPLTQIAQSRNSLQGAAASGRRVFSFLEEKERENEDDKKYVFLHGEEEETKGEVEFDHVSFGYNESREIIHDFSAKIKPGRKVAIVGPTGAGKTTRVNLLERFYEVNSGSIKIDGVDIKDRKREEVHALFAMVLQDTWVFDGTLRENLVYNNKDVKEDDIKNAIHDAHLTHFVRSLPGGLDYEIKADSVISGGQKQLITIARARLKKAPLLILDEATSNVDTRTEEKIQEARDQLSKGKTSFVIAHRLSTIKNADLILVRKDGNIVEQGTHESLLAENGFYASLYNAQFALSAENLID